MLSKQNDGILFFNRGDYPSALLIFNQLLQDQPSLYEAHYNVGITLEKLNQLIEARDELLTAISIDNNIAEAHSHLSFVYFRLKQFSEAERSLKKAIQIDSENAEYHFMLGQLYYLRNQLELSNREYQEAIRLDPENRDAFIHLGNNFFKMERWEEAKKEYEKVLVFSPYDEESHSHLAQYYLHFKQWTEALSEIQLSLRSDPDNQVYLNIRANILYGMVQVEEAMEIASHLIKRFPTYSAPYELLGRCYAAKMDYENAILYYSIAVQHDENNLEAFIGLRTLYERVGDQESSLKMNEKIKQIAAKEETIS